jgi:hypothetical protein
MLVGWAYDPGNSDDLLDIEVVDGTEVVGVGRTGEYRQDLKEAGIGDGFGGVSIPLQEGVFDDEQEHDLYLRIADTDIAITRPKIIQKKEWPGHVDGVSGDVLTGWASNPAQPAVPLEIDVIVDGTFAERVIADQPRRDVPEYYGSSLCGFTWAVPLELADGRSHHITARIANTSAVLSGYASYMIDQASPGLLLPSLIEIPVILREERRYMAFVDQYYLAARVTIETITADAVIYSGHAAHEFAPLLVRHFPRAYIGPLDRVMASPTVGVEAGCATLCMLHTDLTLFVARCLTGAGNHFFSERIRSRQPTILLVESPDDAGGLERLDLDRTRLWCKDIMEAAFAQDMKAALRTTLIDFFFGHPGFVLSFTPIMIGSVSE